MSMGKQSTGTSDLGGNLFDLIQNAELYSERLKTLQDAEAAAKAAEESFGLAQQGRLALNSAQAIRAAADTALSEANGKAKDILEEASIKAKGIVDDAQARASSVDAATAEAQAKLDKVNATISTLDDEISKKREAAQKVEDNAAAVMAEAVALKDEYAEKAQKLKALL